MFAFELTVEVLIQFHCYGCFQDTVATVELQYFVNVSIIELYMYVLQPFAE